MYNRRSFLRSSGLSAVALNLYSVVSCQNDEHESSASSYDGPVLRVAIMGIGIYGNIVASAMQQCRKAKLAGVISGSPTKVKVWQAKYQLVDKNIYDYSNFDEIKNNPDIDTIYVIVPSFLHKPYVLRAAKNRQTRYMCKATWFKMQHKVRK